MDCEDEGPGTMPGPSARTFGRGLPRRHDHDHLAAFQAGKLLDLRQLTEFFAHALQQVDAEVLTHHFAPADPEGQLDLVAFLDAAAHAPHLDIVITSVSPLQHLYPFNP